MCNNIRLPTLPSYWICTALCQGVSDANLRAPGKVHAGAVGGKWDVRVQMRRAVPRRSGSVLYYQPSNSSCKSVSFVILDYLSNAEPHFKRQKTKNKKSNNEKQNQFLPWGKNILFYDT